MEITKAREQLIALMESSFKDKTFHSYIMHTLAGDFAVEIADQLAPLLDVKMALPYVETAEEIGKLVTEKQAAYGDSFGKSGAVMRILYPNGISPDQLDDALTTTRILDKLFRIANQKEAFAESPYRDIAGYALLSVVRDEARART